jgi:ATP-dependent DNA helicase RecQ
MKTGAGKSLCYQLPAILRPGLTVVVSPLIALMRDQVMQLRAVGVAAGALNSGNLGGETLMVERAIEERRLKVVYVAPERFALPGLVDLFERGGASLFVIDEAHCISQWGHDFRPEYLALREIAEDLGGLQTIAVTATANEQTRAEIIERLFARPPRVLVSSFDRPNIRIVMEPKTDGFNQIATFVARHRGESGIIYCASRDRTEKFATALSARGHRAIAYHAGLDPETRSAHQDEFVQAAGVVMCATIAFGMGVDKANTRFVCHADTPGSIEAWYQEIGRAGRDGLPAETLTLWSERDFARKRRHVLDANTPRVRKGAELAKADALFALCVSSKCRRQVFLASFGEASEPCGNCDVCGGLFGSQSSRLKLPAAWRAPGRAVATQIGKVLSGEASEMLRRHARALPRAVAARLTRTFSTTRALSPERAPVEQPLVKVSEGPWSEISLTIDQNRLLTKLKARRLALAKAERRPAHAIFPDGALLAIATSPPRSMTDLDLIQAVAGADYALYGAAFRDVVDRHEAGGP